MWRQLKAKKDNINYKSPSMIQAMKKAEEKRRADAAKALEQAEKRKKRAESRIPPQELQNQEEVRTVAAEAMVVDSGTGVEENRGDRDEEVDELDGGHTPKGQDGEDSSDEGSSSSSDEDPDSFLYGQEIPIPKPSKERPDKGKARKVSSDKYSEEEGGEKVKREGVRVPGELIEKNQRFPLGPPKGDTQVPGPSGKPAQKSLMDRLVGPVQSGQTRDVRRLRKEIDSFELEKEEVAEQKRKRVKEEKRREKEGEKRRKKGRGSKGKKEKSKEKSNKKRKHSNPSSDDDSSSSSSDQSDGELEDSNFGRSSSSALESDSSDGSVLSKESKKKGGKDKPIAFAFKSLSGFDLPDLPIQWEKNFRRMKYFVPLSVFDASYIDAYWTTCKTKAGKLKWDSYMQSRWRQAKKQRGGNRGRSNFSKPYFLQSVPSTSAVQSQKRDSGGGKEWVALGQQHASNVASGPSRAAKKNPKSFSSNER
ncbi:uncharacterized protein MELLADRAFT_111740 [Melampsora larici-populina 98AG31]|uniref:Uncharacterized protein n=1 Tax=Melampsora larici-populina (strain 98AG31 / pathotype 3-4-7) TaxID=747676 RepID=F4S4D7_MELLP|nr:uncharacterized protein MELLADRAFT_111740 [Melampsora larici-populina 98AG31]EGG00510.1 hypothetical protein MELLADRAFT_111740 [Melampsora larici-populina 98AG31]